MVEGTTTAVAASFEVGLEGLLDVQEGRRDLPESGAREKEREAAVAVAGRLEVFL